MSGLSESSRRKRAIKYGCFHTLPLYPPLSHLDPTALIQLVLLGKMGSRKHNTRHLLVAGLPLSFRGKSLVSPLKIQDGRLFSLDN